LQTVYVGDFAITCTIYVEGSIESASPGYMYVGIVYPEISVAEGRMCKQRLGELALSAYT